MIGVNRDGVGSAAGSSKCDELHKSTFDLDRLFKSLLAHSPTLRDAHEARRRQIPELQILFEVDFALRPEAGGGTTAGLCDAPTKRISIDPVFICKNPTDRRGESRDLVKVLIHELGHVFLCDPRELPKPPGVWDNSAEENAVHAFVEQVETELYSTSGPRDPFQAPHFITPSRPLHE